MIKEAKNIDFYTSGRQLSDQDFLRISEWIKKKKQTSSQTKKRVAGQKHLAQQSALRQRS